MLRCAIAASLLSTTAAAWAQGPERPAARTELLQRAADALNRGDAMAALRDYESAAAQEHGAEIELGIVRSLMLGGHYRRALAFAAHTAQAHPDTAAGAHLYAQLLEAGGQPRLAARVRPPEAPAAPQSAPVLATGVLIDDGRHALLPLAAVADETAALELRDAHGLPLPAQVVQRNPTLALALLRLSAPPADAPRLAWASRAAFPGSPALAIAAAPATATPWPRLHSGFVGAGGLGIGLQGDAPGGAVFDRSGRAIGIALASDDGGGRIASAPALRAWLGDLLGPSADPAAPARSLDAIYEDALRATVQRLRSGSSRPSAATAFDATQ